MPSRQPITFELSGATILCLAHISYELKVFWTGSQRPACRLLLLSFVCIRARKANTFLPTGIGFSLCVRKHCGEKEGTHSVACVALYRFTIYLFLTLKPRAFIYSGTPPYGHLVNIFFGRHAKTSISVFSCKETLVNTTTTTTTTTTTSLFSITILYRCYRLK